MLLTLLFGCTQLFATKTSAEFDQGPHHVVVTAWTSELRPLNRTEVTIDGEDLHYAIADHHVSPPDSQVSRTWFVTDERHPYNAIYVFAKDEAQFDRLNAFLATGTGGLQQHLLRHPKYSTDEFVLQRGMPRDVWFHAESGDVFGVSPSGSIYRGTPDQMKVRRAASGTVFIGELSMFGIVRSNGKPGVPDMYQIDLSLPGGSTFNGVHEVKFKETDPSRFKEEETGLNFFEYYGLTPEMGSTYKPGKPR